MKPQEERINNYLQDIRNLLHVFPQAELREAIEAIEAKTTEQKRIWIVGNGGSAMTGSHFATDLTVGTFRRTNVRVLAFSLCDNSGILTATANDLSFDDVFSEQLSVYAEPGDILFVITASGNSKNLIKAINKGKQLGLFVIALTGFDGGECKKICDLSIHFQTPKGAYGITEDLHSITCHVIAEEIRKAFS